MRVAFCLLIVGYFAELGVGDVVEAPGLSAGVGILSVGAGEAVLTEHGLVAAHEGEVGRLHQGADVVSDGETDMEQLAVVVHVSVVSVGQVLAGEGGVEGARQHGLIP